MLLEPVTGTGKSGNTREYPGDWQKSNTSILITSSAAAVVTSITSTTLGTSSMSWCNNQSARPMEALDRPSIPSSFSASDVPAIGNYSVGWLVGRSVRRSVGPSVGRSVDLVS